MAIMIHGKEYVTVAERLKLLHEQKDLKGKISIKSELVSAEPVVVKATLTLNGQVFTGISAANPSKSIEKISPYEVAETSAVGRALGFAGFGSVEGIASADEMLKAEFAKADMQPLQSADFSATEQHEHTEGESCHKCGSAQVVERNSRSSKSFGRPYYYCDAHKGFSHWVEPVKAVHAV
jgi:hypothetical protein